MSENQENLENKIIINGITDEGVKFRPSDWAERMCGSLSTFRDRRMIYSPLLRPVCIDGIKCVVVDPELEKSHAPLFKYIFEFAQKNNLKVTR